MLLHLGGERMVASDEIVGIFPLKAFRDTPEGQREWRDMEERGRVQRCGAEPPKSVVVWTRPRPHAGQALWLLSPLSAATLTRAVTFPRATTFPRAVTLPRAVGLPPRQSGRMVSRIGIASERVKPIE